MSKVFRLYKNGDNTFTDWHESASFPYNSENRDGKNGIDGINGQAGSNGLTPEITLSYNNVTGNLEYSIEYSDDINSMLKEW